MLALVSLVSANDHAVWTVTQALAINESGVILAAATRDEGGSPEGAPGAAAAGVVALSTDIPVRHSGGRVSSQAQDAANAQAR